MKQIKFLVIAVVSFLPILASCVEPLLVDQNKREESFLNNKGIDLDLELGFSSFINDRGRVNGGFTEKFIVGYNTPLTPVISGGFEVYLQHNDTQCIYGASEYTVAVFHLDWNMGIDLKVGFVVDPSTLVFVRAGVDQGRFRFNYYGPSTVAMNNGHMIRYKMLGGAFGAGVEHNFSDQWFLKGALDMKVYDPSSSYSPLGLLSGVVSIGYQFPIHN
ncbi:MAG: hypothetical protein P0S95_08070 [Rhabdochlamydiaceae bacterium]|nr:hypothetical protein [Candidatus Amphrikana amoebophyrae]